MDESSITLIAALIATIAAIVAPTLTAIINNAYNSKMRKADFNRTVRSKVLEEYIIATTKYIHNRSEENQILYTSSLAKAYLYAPEKASDLMFELDTYNFDREDPIFLDGLLTGIARIIGVELSKY